MKKVILFLFLAIGFVLQAQTVNFLPMVNGATVQSTTQTYVLTNTTARNFVYNAPQPKPTTQDFTIKLDSLAGNHIQIVVTVYGQKSATKGDWTQIGTATSTAGADVVLISNATANRYSNYKYTLTGTGTGTTTVTSQILKLYLE